MDVDISHNQAKHAEDRIFRGDDPSVGGVGVGARGRIIAYSCVSNYDFENVNNKETSITKLLYVLCRRIN